MQWPFEYNLAAKERQRELLASAPDPRARREPPPHVAPPRGWRRLVWALGHALEQLGQRVEEMVAANGRA